MTKKVEQQSTGTTPDHLRNEAVTKAFEKISEESLHLLKVFESAQYRTVATVDHLGNDRYPNLVRESISYFWNLTLSKNKTGNLVIYFSYDTEAISKFGTMIYNQTLRTIFATTSAATANVNIEDSVRINSVTKNVKDFFFKRIMDGENESVSIKAVEHVTQQK
ncbi:hypothetical protein SAMN06265348_110263 [Pedobacter westerhofensis]|uniref:Uncharacterized protein n=1 Tax=Pedobacter westerhofensis TaxID=425512 RepID=A0A521F9D2_9SPHI|nr:hypothetical protein [Pedobacter westerhofensis]SMO92100.1 hypothetical protein SAMN06265348_110263 [Pedobacter westerhofensis]